ncbi:MAG TPA: NAD-dependent epimerase/dehydratase family protein [Gaiellaceae bacterium]|nr:NAD-dependent epimerase/dehydratase family protein [Gaiellaceae bacterium]
MRVFVAGAGGIVGRHLVPELVARGHQVVATTRNPARQEALRSLGATPAVMDGLDPASVGEAVARAEPEVIVHEMTALASFRSPRSFDREFAVTNELRTTGTDNLIAAAGAVGVRRIVAQSYTGWPNERTGGPVKTEEDPLDTDPPARQRRSLEAIVHLERVVLAAAPVEGLAVRYGALYGPGTSAEEFGRLLLARKFPLVGDGGGIWSFVHVADAAAATALAVERGAPGLYNIVDDHPAPVREWLPYLAECVGAPPPRHLPPWLARLAIGETGVSWMTRIRGSSNEKAKRELGWTPVWSSWREGFREGAADRTLRPAA